MVTSSAPSPAAGSSNKSTEGIRDQRAADLDDLLRSQRQVTGLAMGVVGESEPIQHVHADRAGLGLFTALCGEHQELGQVAVPEEVVTAEEDVLHDRVVQDQLGRLERSERYPP